MHRVPFWKHALFPFKSPFDYLHDFWKWICWAQVAQVLMKCCHESLDYRKMENLCLRRELGQLLQICGHWHKKNPLPPQTSYYHYLIGPDAIELICHIWKHKTTYTCKNERIWKGYFHLQCNLFCGWLSHANTEVFFLTKSCRKIFDHIKSKNNYEYS